MLHHCSWAAAFNRTVVALHSFRARACSTTSSSWKNTPCIHTDCSLVECNSVVHELSGGSSPSHFDILRRDFRLEGIRRAFPRRDLRIFVNKSAWSRLNKTSKPRHCHSLAFSVGFGFFLENSRHAVKKLEGDLCQLHLYRRFYCPCATNNSSVTLPSAGTRGVICDHHATSQEHVFGSPYSSSRVRIQTSTEAQQLDYSSTSTHRLASSASLYCCAPRLRDTRPQQATCLSAAQVRRYTQYVATTLSPPPSLFPRLASFDSRRALYNLIESRRGATLQSRTYYVESSNERVAKIIWSELT